MRVSKHHGLRNDFLVVLDERHDVPVDAGPDLARRLCDRRSGLGADGLIHGARPGADSDADVAMRLWNADGSRAEMSGNGIRCLAQAVALARGTSRGTIVVDSDTGRRELTIEPTDDHHTFLVAVDLGAVGGGPGVATTELPFAPKEVATADLGNPHLVAWVDEADELASIDLAVVGPAIESAYPDGINIEVITPVAGVADAIDLRVWERGVGITQACGTGACAAAHLAHRWGLVGTRVQVRMPGGSVVVSLVDGRAVLQGPAVLVADLHVGEGVVLDG